MTFLADRAKGPALRSINKASARARAAVALSMEAFNNGSTLADYDMSEADLIGRGKFSVVHRTRRKRDGKRVALKKIQVFEMMDSKCRNECLNEIKLLQSLGHPNIVQYLDAFIEDNELHVAMELAERGDLGGLIKRAAGTGTPLPEGQVWEYFAQIADALRYMHGQRVMHRDIKPANVFIMDSGVLKLGDLGAFGSHLLLLRGTLQARAQRIAILPFLIGCCMSWRAVAFAALRAVPCAVQP